MYHNIKNLCPLRCVLPLCAVVTGNGIEYCTEVVMHFINGGISCLAIKII